MGKGIFYKVEGHMILDNARYTVTLGRLTDHLIDAGAQTH